MNWIRRSRGRPPHPDVLTPAEWRVLERVRAGRTNQQIADDLGVSINTVRAHVSSMLGKLGFEDRNALSRWEGAPAPASRAALDRMGLLVWWRWAAVGVLTAAAGFAIWFLMDASRPGASTVAAPPSPASAATPSPSAIPTETPSLTAPPEAPYRADFEAGEVIDVAPAALFVTAEGGTTAWVFPDHTGGDLGVSPGGSFIIWQHGAQFRLFTTEDAVDLPIEVTSMPVTYAPDEAGFIARHEEGFYLSAFDLDGEIGWGLWRGADEQTVADWGVGGIAVGGKGTATRVSLWRKDGSQTGYLVDEASPAPLSLRWSPDGERLAVVTGAWVRVFNLDGAQLWEQRGEFYGNPRWAPDGQHLFVNAMPPSGGDVAYVFTENGELLWRYRAEDPRGYGYTCGGDVWLDAVTIGIGSAAVSVDGTVEEPRLGTVDMTPSDLGVEAAPGLGLSWIRVSETDWRTRLLDGRYVFQTWPFSIGRGGCAEGVTVELTGAAGIEYPPFYDDELIPAGTPSNPTSR